MENLGHFLAVHPAVLVAIAFILGLIVGSFLNVVIYRLPVILDRTWRQHCHELLGNTTGTMAPTERFDLAYPPSRCPHCGHDIGVLENIPAISYLIQRGRCRHCGNGISLRYPVVELLTASLTAVIAWHFGYTLTAVAALFFVWSLIALSFIDYDQQILPDSITLPLLWAGLLINAGNLFAPLSSAVLGAAGGYLFLYSVFHLFKLVTGKEGMGFGDFKLFAMFGAWLGWNALPLIILLASFVGAIVGLVFILVFGRDRHLPIPFGPFLCISALITLLWGDTMTHTYLEFARLRP